MLVCVWPAVGRVGQPSFPRGVLLGYILSIGWDKDTGWDVALSVAGMEGCSHVESGPSVN